jgi:LDH2 family malate/lactate/ureidoglycolate dehydrogenase
MTMRVPAEIIRQQITSILNSWGMEAGLVRATADAMVATDLAGVDSHGISMLMDYEKSAKKGKLNLKAKPRIVRETPVTALIDADAGLGHPAATMGMELAIRKAQAMHVGVVTVRNSHHFGAAGYYSSLATKCGLIGLVTSASRTINTVPTRSAVPVLGTNPISFAAPTRRNRPFLLDMATASAAANKVKVYDFYKKPLPSGWVVNEKGEAVTDAAEALNIIHERPKDIGGGLTPVGGKPEMASHKGYGLAVLAHVLGGTLSGASFSPVRVKTQKAEDPDDLGHFFMALDPKAFRDEGEFEDDMDTVIDVLHNARPVDPAEPVLVHGDPEAMICEDRLKNGVPIPPALAEKIKGICERSGVPFLLKA